MAECVGTILLVQPLETTCLEELINLIEIYYLYGPRLFSYQVFSFIVKYSIM